MVTTDIGIRSAMLRGCPVRPWRRKPQLLCAACYCQATSFVVDRDRRIATCPCHYGTELDRIWRSTSRCEGYPRLRQTWREFAPEAPGLLRRKARAVRRRLRKKMRRSRAHG